MSGDGVVRNLLVVFGVEVKNLLAAEKLQDGINAIEDGLGRLNSMAQKAALGLTALAGALVVGTKPIADMAENTKKYAAAFGISAQRMQELTYGFEALGAKGDDLSDVFLQISEKARQATGGSKEAQAAFKDLGIGINELSGMKPDQLFDRLIVSFQNVGDAQTKFALISQVMGEDLGKKLLPIMTKGGASLEEYAQIARDAGAVMNDSQVIMGARVANTYRRLTTVIQALRMRIGLELLPYVDRIGTKMWDWYQANKALINQKIHEYAQKIGDGLEWVKNTTLQIGRMIESMGGLEVVLKRVAIAFAVLTGLKIAGILVSIASGVYTVLSALATGAAAAVLPIVALAAAYGLAIGVILEDLATFQRDGESLFGFLQENYDELPAGFQALYQAINMASGVFDEVIIFFKWLGKESMGWAEDLLPLLPWLLAGFIALGGAFVLFVIAPFAALGFLIVVIVDAVKMLGRALSALWEGTVAGAKYTWETTKQIVKDLWNSLWEFIGSIPDMWDGLIKGMVDFFIAWAQEFLNLMLSIPLTIFEVLKTPFNYIKALLGEIGGLVDGILKGAGAVLDVGLDIGKAIGSELVGLGTGSIAQGQGQATMPWNSVATRESRNGAKGGASSRNVTVTQGDTVIQVNGAGDPAAVAGKVQQAQKASMDRLFNGAANNAGGM
jgi:methyl-accepting chemotaxis protein